MKRIKKRYIFIFSLFFLLGIVVASLIIIVYFPHIFRRYTIPKTVNVFGEPRVQNKLNFPSNNPHFTAIIGKIKPASLHQQSIIVYQIKDPKRIPVFERPFYADGFHGNELIYTLSSDSAVITQNGSLSSLGCKSDDCTLKWTNFYTWDTTQHTFVLDNTSHKTEFQQLFSTYQTIDRKGCSIVGSDQLSKQQGLSFTELYKKFPTDKYYCSSKQGIFPSNLIYFLQTEKTLQEIVNGENVGSADIRDINF